MDCRNITWSSQPAHLNGTEKGAQETSQKVHAGRVGCALPQPERSEIARDCFLCSKPQDWNPRSLAAMPSTQSTAGTGSCSFLAQRNHYLWQLITMEILQTQSNLRADNTANQAVTEPHKACRLWGECCTMKKHQSPVHFHIFVCHLDSTNCQELYVSC